MRALLTLVRLSISLLCFTVVQAAPNEEIIITPGRGLPSQEEVKLRPDVLYNMTHDALKKYNWLTSDMQDNLHLEERAVDSNTKDMAVFPSNCGIDGALSLDGEPVSAAPLGGVYACYLYLNALRTTSCAVEHETTSHRLTDHCYPHDGVPTPHSNNLPAYGAGYNSTLACYFYLLAIESHALTSYQNKKNNSKCHASKAPRGTRLCTAQHPYDGGNDAVIMGFVDTAVKGKDRVSSNCGNVADAVRFLANSFTCGTMRATGNEREPWIRTVLGYAPARGNGEFVVETRRGKVVP
ncbi:hypothetical protein QBC34DRAFT_443096 [Podospora aff. communis PSN243]|uniref:Uncharacterized protein n=1 Tax=Podospora aff. communis PSN243 TaxID=3040156 RepID=A0AAV9G5B4_9PEZI|nr:hypothetical protein QBC34DRAFT_443096 [Podospora aff. communis PSN243]